MTRNYEQEKAWGVNNFRGILYGLAFSGLFYGAVAAVIVFINSLG